MFEQIIRILRSSARVGLFVHTHPDGDAMGSAYALSLALSNMGKRSRVFLPPSPDVQARSLVVTCDDDGLEISDCDLLVALDCADSQRLGSFGKAFLAHPNTIAIDHHVTHKPFARSATVFTEISSTCELIYMLLRDMSEEVTRDIASNLYIGLATDTGHFKYASVTGDTLRVVADLIDTGIDFSHMARVLFTTKSVNYYSLLRTVIDKIQILCDGRVAVVYITDEDLKKAGITEAETNAIVTIPGSIEGVEVGVYIRRREDGEYKISLRSNDYVDVAALASLFGGGGHIRASGYSVYNKSADKIIEELSKELDKIWPD